MTSANVAKQKRWLKHGAPFLFVYRIGRWGVELTGGLPITNRRK